MQVHLCGDCILLSLVGRTIIFNEEPRSFPGKEWTIGIHQRWLVHERRGDDGCVSPIVGEKKWRPVVVTERSIHMQRIDYESVIDQMTFGHQFLLEEFGVVPRIGWHVDPFGHSATQASLFAQVDFCD